MTAHEENIHDAIADQQHSIRSFLIANLKRTAPTILSFDSDIELPILGIFMTHLGHPKAAALVTTYITIFTYLQFASVMPASFQLGTLSGKHSVTPSPLLNQAIANVPRNGFYSSLIWTPLTFSAMFFSERILLTLGQEASVARDAQNFLRPFAAFFCTFSLRLLTEFILLAFKHQNGAMLIALCSIVLSLSLQYVFTFYLSLRLFGLALGYGAGFIFTLLGYITYATQKFKSIHLLDNILSGTASLKEITTLFKASLPILVTGISDIASSFAINIFAGFLNKNALATLNVSTQYLNINFFIIVAASQTSAFLASEQIGKANAKPNLYNAIKLIIVAGILATLLLQLPLIAFVTSAPHLFSKLIGTPKNASVDEHDLRHLLLITVAYSIMDGIRWNLLQAIRSIGDYTIPSLLSTLFIWIGILCSFFLSRHTDLGLLGLPLGLLIGSSAGSLFLATRLNTSIIKAYLTKKPTQDNHIQHTLSKPSLNWYNIFANPISINTPDEDCPSETRSLLSS